MRPGRIERGKIRVHRRRLLLMATLEMRRMIERGTP